MSGVDRPQSPSLGGASGWLNSEPLELDELRGRVVLVDFWTFTCINWLRTEPYIRAWSQAYRDDGLIVIGVHTPEFSVEHDTDSIQQAVTERGIDYPVAVDNDYAIWTAFDNHYWPALYFIDKEGVVRDHHFGEGRYEESERVIQRLLGVAREPVRVVGEGVEAQADWDQLRTVETYLGYGRAENFASPVAGLDERRSWEYPARLRTNEWALAGEWTIGREKVAAGPTGGNIAFRFHARDLHLVMGAADQQAKAQFRVTLDGQAPGEAHGLDVDPNGNGAMAEARLYQLIRQPGAITEHTFEIAFSGMGVDAYVFTFG